MDNCKIYNNEKFRKNLEYLISSKGITKKALEQELEVGEGYLSRLTREGNTQEPSVHLMKNLSTILGVTIDELVYQDIEVQLKILNGNEKAKELIKKLINETRELSLEWSDFNLVATGDNYRTVETDLYYYVSFEEQISVFASKYGRKYENIKGNKSRGWIANLNNGTEVIFVNIIYQSGEEYLELYLNNNGKAYDICSSDFGDIGIDVLLRELFKCINFDVDEYIKDKLIDEYLKENNNLILEQDISDIF